MRPCEQQDGLCQARSSEHACHTGWTPFLDRSTECSAIDQRDWLEESSSFFSFSLFLAHVASRRSCCFSRPAEWRWRHAGPSVHLELCERFELAVDGQRRGVASYAAGFRDGVASVVHNHRRSSRAGLSLRLLVEHRRRWEKGSETVMSRIGSALCINMLRLAHQASLSPCVKACRSACQRG